MKTTEYILSKNLFDRGEILFLIDIDDRDKTKGYDIVQESINYSSLFITDSYIKRDFCYYYKEELVGVLPHKLKFLLRVFEESESILKLENDWDDNNSSKYDLLTWKAAIKFLIDYSVTLLNDFNTTIDKPKIYNGPNGTIDILWEYDTYTFLVNIARSGIDASFYADNTINTQRIRGEFKLDNFKKTLLPFAIQF